MFLRIRQQTISFSSVAVGTLLLFAWTFIFFVPKEVGAAGSIPSGTLVEVAPLQTVSPETVMVGDPVQLQVLQDVKVNGKVVIATGARAKGEITAAERKGLFGKPAKIGIGVRSIEAVDGTSHLAYGNKVLEGEDKMAIAIITTVLCLVGFLIFKGGDAAITPGAPIHATIS